MENKIYLYMRISRDKTTKKDSETLKRNQEYDIDTNFLRQEFLFANSGYDLKDEKYTIVKEITSGQTLSLPKLETIIEKMTEGDLLVVPELQRLVRNIHYGLGILYRLKEKGANLISLDGSFGTSTDIDNPSDFLNFSIRLLLDHYQALELKKKQKDTIKALKEKGVKIGRPITNDDLTTELLAEYKKHGYKLDLQELAKKHNVVIGSLYSRLKSNGIDIKKEKQQEELKIYHAFLNLRNDHTHAYEGDMTHDILGVDKDTLKKIIRNCKRREEKEKINNIINN